MRISGNEPYQVSGQLQPNTLLAWYEQSKQSQTEQPESGNLLNTLPIEDTVEISGHIPYEKRDGISLMVIHDSKHLSSYFSLLFRTSTEKANERIIGLIANGGSGGSGWDTHTIDLSVARYQELRGQIITDFGNDNNLLETYLDTLNKAFLSNLHSIALSAAHHLESEREHERWAINTGNDPLYKSNPLGTHKDFNMNTFLGNTLDLMKQIVQAFFQNIQDDAASIWELTVEYMMQKTETSSINNLSLNDFMIFEQSRWSTATTKEEDIAARNRNYAAFLSNPNLSEYLRNILK